MHAEAKTGKKQVASGQYLSTGERQDQVAGGQCAGLVGDEELVVLGACVQAARADEQREGICGQSARLCRSLEYGMAADSAHTPK